MNEEKDFNSNLESQNNIDSNDLVQLISQDSVSTEIIEGQSISNAQQNILTQVTNESKIYEPNSSNKISGKKIDKELIIVLILVFIVVLGLVGRFVVFSINKKTNNAFLLSLNNLKTEMSQIVKPIAFLPTDYSENYGIEGNIDVNIAYDQYNEEIALGEEGDALVNLINKIKFEYATKIDIKNKKLLYQLNPKINGEELFNVKLINNDKTNYLFLGNIYDKYIQLEDVNFEVTDAMDDSIRTEEINEIYDVILQSLKENLKEEYFIREETTIKVGDDTKEVLKNTLVLNQQNTIELSSNIVKSLKENEKTNSIITKYYPEFFNEFEEQIELSKDIEDSSVLYFSTYMNKITGNHYQYEIKTTSEYEDFSINYILGDTKEININYIYKYNEEYNESYKILIDTNDEETIIEVKDINNRTIIKSTITEEKITYDQSYQIDNQDVLIKFSYEINQVEGKEEYKINMRGLLELSEDDQSLVTINIDSDNLLKKNISINENITSVIKSSEMTDEDFNEIMTRLFSIYGEAIE